MSSEADVARLLRELELEVEVEGREWMRRWLEDYEAVARRGWPIGSGAVESACRGRQYRHKRPGQFWTRLGRRDLDALEEARDNGHRNALRLTA